MYIERAFMRTDGQAQVDRGETPQDQILKMESTQLIDENGDVWMSNDPADVMIVESMVDFIDSGSVLEIGLGMAYSYDKLKRRIEHPVIEIAPHVEELGRTYWRERMPDHADVILSDYKTVKHDPVDYIFIDIDTMDYGLPFKDKSGMKKIEKLLKPKGFLIPYIAKWPTKKEQLPKISGFSLVATKEVVYCGMPKSYESQLRYLDRKQGYKMTNQEILDAVERERARQTRTCWIGKWRKN